jgi:hypothetical protein
MLADVRDELHSVTSTVAYWQMYVEFFKFCWTAGNLEVLDKQQQTEIHKTTLKFSLQFKSILRISCRNFYRGLTEYHFFFHCNFQVTLHCGSAPRDPDLCLWALWGMLQFFSKLRMTFLQMRNIEVNFIISDTSVTLHLDTNSEQYVTWI